jgi:hypothetical protein
MKSTIKLTTSKSLTVQPCKTGGILIELDNPNALHALAAHTTLQLTMDQAGALLFAIEQAAEAASIADHRMAA